MKKKLNTPSLSNAYYTLVVLLIALLIGVIITSCNNEITDESTVTQPQEQAHKTGDDKAGIQFQFKQKNLQDRSHEANREAIATFTLQGIIKPQDWKLQVQVQVIPTGVLGTSMVDCTSELIKKDTTTPGNNTTSTQYIYRFTDNIARATKPFTAAFTFKPAAGVSEMMVTFQLVKNNLSIGEPCTVTWQAAPQMEWIEIADNQEIKDNESFTMGLTNVGDRIINTTEVTIQLSSEQALKLFNNSGSFKESTLAALLDPTVPQQITKNNPIKFNVGVIGDGIKAIESPATLEVFYKQEKIAERKIKWVKDYKMELKFDTTVSKSVKLLGFGPFNLAVKNIGTHPINLDHVGVKVQSKAKFFINGHSVEETEKQSLAQVIGIPTLAENQIVDLPLQLQPGNAKKYAHIDITLYELANPTQPMLTQLSTEWESGIIVKVKEKKGLTFIGKDHKAHATVELERFGEKMLLSGLVVKVEEANQQMQFTVQEKIFGNRTHLTDFIHYDIQSILPVDETRAINATVKVYYQDRGMNIYLGKCKIKWEKKK